MYEAKVCVNPPVSKAVKSPRAGNSNRILVIIVLVNTHYGPVVQGHTRKSWDPLYKVACASMRGHGFLLGFHFRNKMKLDCHARCLKRITRRIAQKVENRQDHNKAITFHKLPIQYLSRAPSARYVAPVIARLRRAGRKVISEAGKDFIR